MVYSLNVHALWECGLGVQKVGLPWNCGNGEWFNLHLYPLPMLLNIQWLCFFNQHNSTHGIIVIIIRRACVRYALFFGRIRICLMEKPACVF